MVNDNSLSSADNDYCFYKEGEVYVVYLKNGGTTNLDLGAAEGSFQVRWYDPRNGGSLQTGSVSEVAGGDEVALGNAPSNTGKDWVILVTSHNPDLPGTLAFSTSDFSAAENAGSATITVTRTGGTGGEVSVDYATSDGTAEAGHDYTATSGTLVLGDGKSSATFEVDISDDQEENGSRTVNLTVSNPGGGAELGTPTEAVLTIVDNESAAEPQQWTFDIDTEGWVYVDDAFRSTSHPDQAEGTHTGEALKVTIGGAASGSDGGISGGWEKEFTVDTDARLALSFDYQLTNTRFDDDEYTEVLVMFDGALVGTGGNDYVEHLAGRRELEWKQAEIDLGTVSSGAHTLTIGLYNNKRTTVEEQGDLLIDNVSVTSDRQTVAPALVRQGNAVLGIRAGRRGVGGHAPSLLLGVPVKGAYSVSLFQPDGRCVYRHRLRVSAAGAYHLSLPSGLTTGGACIARLSGESATISRVVPMIR